MREESNQMRGRSRKQDFQDEVIWENIETMKKAPYQTEKRHKALKEVGTWE